MNPSASSVPAGPADPAIQSVVLASASPRRREILQNLGLRFEVLAADVDETCTERDPARLCEVLAARKGEAVRARLAAEGRDLSKTLVIASDTVVAVPDGDGDAATADILGKPRDAADARRMLALLSGRTHRVVSGIWIALGGASAVSHDVTEVVFDRLTAGQIDRYVASGEPFGKAGAYAIQGHAAPFIAAIRGDYFNVVGLPVHRLATLCRETFGKELF